MSEPGDHDYPTHDEANCLVCSPKPLAQDEEESLRRLDATTQGEHGNVVRRLLATVDAERSASPYDMDALRTEVEAIVPGEMGSFVGMKAFVLAIIDKHRTANQRSQPHDSDSPQWEDCKVCGGDHRTEDHPAPHRDWTW